MERDAVKVQPGWEYDHYFPRAQVGRVKVKENATVKDTLRLIPKIVCISMRQSERFAQEVIKGSTIEETCRNLWNFTYKHIAYKKDAAFKEQVRDIARIWHDRHNFDPLTKEQMGVDCDCLSVWCAAILCNLGLGDYLYFRITKYPDPNNPNKTASEISWSHIYPVLILPNGKQITIDCVVHQFNYEEPYLEKQDTKMDLEYLNGVPMTNRMGNADTQDLMGMMDEHEALSELGKIFKKKSAAKKSSGGGDAGHQKKKGGFIKKVGKVVGKGLHVINRINPATALLRGGVLAAMKLNFLKIAGSLRWTYLSEEAAKAKGIIMDKYHKLVKVREKLEKIFFGAGGKPENLRKAMLKGHGNKDKSVALAGLGYTYENVDGLNEDMSLSQLLGAEMYHSEYVDGIDGLEGFNGLGELGEPATAASIAAATTVLSAIAALIKGVGNIFPNKGKAKSGGDSAGNDNASSDDSSSDSGSGSDAGSGSSDSGSGDGSSNEPAADSASDSSSGGDTTSSGDDAKTSGDDSSPGGDDDGATNGSASKSKAPAAKTASDDDADDSGTSNTPALRTAAKTTAPATTKKVSFWENNKKWIKPVGISVGSLALIALMYQLLKPKPKLQHAVNGLARKRKPKPKGDFLNGIKPKRKKGGQAPAKKKAKKKKQVITLL